MRHLAQRSVGAAVQTWVGLAGLPAPARLKAAALAFVMSFTGRMPGIRRMPRTRYDWAAQIDAGGSSIVMACVLWLCRTFPEAPLRVQTIATDGALAPADGHPLVQLLARPNPFYSGVLLWWGTLCDWTISGNSYWIKIRSGAGRPVQLWWVPSPMIEPRWPDDGSAFISHYEYKPDAGKVPIRLGFDDVVHFRYGLDPLNMRKGLSPVASLLREIFTDEEASAYVATMLRNLGVPGAMISPGDDSEISQADAELIKAEYIQRFGGDNRGLPMVLPGRAKVDILGFSPKEMDVKALRRVPEERVTAIFGTPAVVVGLGAGLDRSTFANFAEAREAAYESNVIPTQRLMSEELSTQLLPDFADPARAVLDFDLSKVRVLQPDQDKLHTRARENLKAGLLSLNQSLEMIGKEPLKQGDVYYIPINVTPTSPEELILAPPISTRVTEQTPAVDGGTAAPADQAPAAGGKLRRLPRGRKSADGLARSIERARRRLDAATRRAVQGVLDAQRARVLAHLGAKAADPLDLETEETALRAVLDPQYKRLLEQILGLTADALGISFELDDPATRAYLAAAGTNIRGITETTLQAIRDALQAGQAEGEGVTQLAARIRDLAEFGAARAQTIARTELGHASGLAAVASYRASGVVVGIQILDGDYDAECAARDGRIVPLDAAGAEPPLLHPNCLVGETIVQAAQVQATFARHFDGEVVVIRTAADDLLTCTPNHPILTPDGWVGAGRLRQGDHVVRSLDSQGILRRLDPDYDDVPAAIQKVANTPRPAGSSATAAMPCAPEHFHGDGAGSDVYVVRANRLSGGDMVVGFEPGGEPAIVVTHAQTAPLAGGRPAAEPLVGIAVAPASVVGRDGIGGASGLADAGIVETGTFVTGAHGVTTPLEPSLQAAGSDADAGRDLYRALAGQVASVEIVGIERRQFSGHVYNLETDSGWYIAENIITHNCTAAFAPITDAAELENAA